MTASNFSALFLIFLAAMFALQGYLALRQLSHVAAHRDTVPAEFASNITLEAHQKAADYSNEKTRLGLFESCVDVIFLLAITLGSGLWWISENTPQWLESHYLHGLWTIFALGVVSSLISTPFDLYRTFNIEARYGFNKITLKLYLVDAIKGMAIAAMIGTPLLLLTFWLMERMGAFWWFYVWLMWLTFSALMIAVYPTYIAPLFNKFTPLADENLKSRIEQLLTRCGFTAKGLFVMDGSKRSSHGNAYFTGFGKTKRIVFFDTLIERLTPDEIDAVLAHELGHFKRKHIVKTLIIRFGIALLVLALMGWVIDKPWFYEGLGFPLNGNLPHVAVSLILFFIALPAFTFWMSPLNSLLSRKHEFEADAYAAQQTKADDLITALVKLYRDNASTLTPDPLYSAMYDSHPPAAIRIAHLKALASR